jgi:hypothetical protein
MLYFVILYTNIQIIRNFLEMANNFFSLKVGVKFDYLLKANRKLYVA